ncbi:MAG: glycosyltransferase [Acidobacteria bacterium]|nr:glycosyltransferase [Acidobacteriota bacterium]MBI3661929.1 glycosyltransferase [Acidobacteriota bacterium]
MSADGTAPGPHCPRLMLFTDSFIHGGTERQLVQALRLLDRAKYDVLVGCLKRRGPFLADVEALGVPVHEFPITSLKRWSTVVWFDRLMKFFRDERIDVVHAFDYYTNLFAVPAAYLAEVPVVIASRRNLAHNRTAFERWALRLVCSLTDRVVANSQAAARSHVGLLTSARRKVEVIYNALEPADYRVEHSAADLRESIGLPAGELLAGVVAALRPEKGHRTFLRAAALVAREHPSAKFVLIGDGSERAALQALAAALGITERVIFTGDRRDVPECLAALDLLVLPSDFESLPNAVLEAMAAARPVVASRVGGTPELVDEGVNGYLVPVGDAEAMARRMLELLRDPVLRRAMGEAGRARVEREFVPARMKQRLEELYDNRLRAKQPVARVLQIGNFPPPVCGWSLHTQIVQQALEQRGANSRVMDIGPGRCVEGRGCDTVKSGFDYAKKLLRYRLRGFTFQVHVNGDSWKGYVLALAAVLLGQLTGKPSVLTFHAGPTQLYFPRSRGFWYWAFRLLFAASGEVICNHEPVKKAIAAYGIPEEKIYPIPAFSVQYTEKIPVPLPPAVEEFFRQHELRLFSYSLFRVEFTMEALFEAFAAVRRDFPRAGLLIAGPQEVPPEATAQMRKLGIDGAILVPGNLPHAEFLTAVQRSDVFVRTHLRDGACTSVLEALKLGVPVVASDDGIRPPSVITYAPGDAADLHRKLAAVLGDLAAMRARVRPPEVHNHLEKEISLLLAAGARASEARG